MLSGRTTKIIARSGNLKHSPCENRSLLSHANPHDKSCEIARSRSPFPFKPTKNVIELTDRATTKFSSRYVTQAGEFSSHFSLDLSRTSLVSHSDRFPRGFRKSKRKVMLCDVRGVKWARGNISKHIRESFSPDIENVC